MGHRIYNFGDMEVFFFNVVFLPETIVGGIVAFNDFGLLSLL